MVPGDIFPQLVMNYAVSLSEPLELIYRGVFETYHWPLVWKNEYVTIIPKCPDRRIWGAAGTYRAQISSQRFWNPSCLRGHGLNWNQT